MPWWFLTLVAVGFGVPVRNRRRQLRGSSFHLRAETERRVPSLLPDRVLDFFISILGITAAERLGLITDYAP